MNINDLTIGEAKELANMFNKPELAERVLNKPELAECVLPVGKNMIVRTVTMIYTGRLVAVHKDFLELVDCSWIPETDRFMQFVANGSVRECEPYPDGLPVFINRGALLDVCELKKDLPRIQK
jgi:hypothetical protein